MRKSGALYEQYTIFFVGEYVLINNTIILYTRS